MQPIGYHSKANKIILGRFLEGWGGRGVDSANLTQFTSGVDNAIELSLALKKCCPTRWRLCMLAETHEGLV